MFQSQHVSVVSHNPLHLCHLINNCQNTQSFENIPFLNQCQCCLKRYDLKFIQIYGMFIMFEWRSCSLFHSHFEKQIRHSVCVISTNKTWSRGTIKIGNGYYLYNSYKICAKLKHEQSILVDKHILPNYREQCMMGWVCQLLYVSIHDNSFLNEALKLKPVSSSNQTFQCFLCQINFHQSTKLEHDSLSYSIHETSLT